MAIGSNSIYMGGLFHTIGVKKRIRLAEVDKLTGTPTKWRPKANKEVDDFLVQANRLLIGGKFTRVNDTDAVYLEPLDLTTGALLPWNTPAAYRVLQIDSDGTNIYTAEAGTGGQAQAFDPAGTSLWLQHGDGDSQAVDYLGGTVYVGGHFGTFEDQPLGRLVALDPATGVIDPTWAPRPNVGDWSGVWRLADDSLHLYLGGDFTQVHGIAQQGFAELP